jgi:AcrR family transcriptional regulator
LEAISSTPDLPRVRNEKIEENACVKTVVSYDAFNRMFPPSSSSSLDPTRLRLVEAAGEVFAEHGFHRATIRQITDRAVANVAAVNYYFRDKAELYAVCLRAAHGPGQATSVPPPSLDPEAAPEEQLRQFIHGFLSRMSDSGRPAWHHRIMAREMAEPTEMLGELVNEVIRPQAEQLGVIIALLGGGSLSEDERWMLGFSVVAQALMYSCHRAIVNRLAPSFESAPPPLETMVTHIHQFSLAGIVARIAAGPLAAQNPSTVLS